MQSHANGEVVTKYRRLKDANFLLGKVVVDKQLAVFKEYEADVFLIVVLLVSCDDGNYGFLLQFLRRNSHLRISLVVEFDNLDEAFFQTDE